MIWQEIEGWFDWRAAQEEACEYFPSGSQFLELGLYLGRSICSLADATRSAGKDISLFGVDYCLGSGPEGPREKDYHGQAVSAGGGTLAGALHQNIVRCGFERNITLIIADSVRAAQLFPDRSLDWVHLDGRHDYENVKRDIQAWLPKIRAGGWLSGDDYSREKWPGLVKAVAEKLPTAEPWLLNQWRYKVDFNKR